MSRSRWRSSPRTRRARPSRQAHASSCSTTSRSTRLRGLVEVIRGLEGEAGPIRLEATGGLTLASARAVGETGVDFMSVGALTHSSPIIDLALDLD
ncbi:hypothetical protein GCM10025876_13560 [Demequina litorisediminis]|uniref:Quinolinate phosphoribosyl transferase C-terminal domain-containing protein n=1 Tax=Demequina litorisediminis TaxID=1849022 RepID=A0ABQ6IDT9_9MICO|nr:hypothetical protein GCM10025876_13560 [Demequina litorisediminis]